MQQLTTLQTWGPPRPPVLRCPMSLHASDNIFSKSYSQVRAHLNVTIDFFFIWGLWSADWWSHQVPIPWSCIDQITFQPYVLNLSLHPGTCTRRISFVFLILVLLMPLHTLSSRFHDASRKSTNQSLGISNPALTVWSFSWGTWCRPRSVSCMIMTKRVFVIIVTICSCEVNRWMLVHRNNEI